MSYGIKVRGAFMIEPPLTAAELRDHPEFTEDWKNTQKECYIVVDRAVQAAEDGENVVMRGVSVAVTSPDDAFSRSGLNPQLQAIIVAYPGHEFTGFLELTGQDGDKSRLVVRDGVLIEQQPRLVWPDEIRGQ